jgi:xanthine dehydrogenase small subunit
MRETVHLYLNGAPKVANAEEAFLTLSTWLRREQHATGTKVVCEEGDCGACTVLVGRPRDGRLEYQAVNSCIQLVGQLDGTHVISVEGVSTPGQLSAVQQSMVDHHGAQCGYCTPGFIVAMTALAEERRDYSAKEVKEALTGNLCRCTGYVSIIEAALAAKTMESPSLDELYPPAPIAEALSDVRPGGFSVAANGRRFFAAATLEDALRFRKDNPNCVILQGGTDLGVQANKRGLMPEALMTISAVESLHILAMHGNELVVGANVSLSRLMEAVRKSIPELHKILGVFGAPQIRNAGTLAGNIANGSPIADTLPFLFVAGAKIEATSLRGSRQIDINDFYLGYKKLDLKGDELITRVIIPIPSLDETLKLYKVSRRRDLDISAFTAAFRMRIDGGRMKDVKVAFGGVAPTVIRMPKVEAILEGSSPDEETFLRAAEAAKEIAPITDVRGSAGYRLLLAENIVKKLYLELRIEKSISG